MLQLNSQQSILVTGCEGQLGSELLRQLGSSAVGFNHAELNIVHRAPIRSALNEHKPQVVINTAAYTKVDQAEDDKANCRKVNHLAVGHLAETCEEIGTRLVHISTDYVFGGDQERTTPYLETDKPDPISAYGRAKHGGEQQAKRCANHLVIRTCGLYGTQGANFVKTILRFASRNRKLQVVNDQHCTPSYVGHVAQAVIYLARHETTGIIHVTNDGATTWFDFASEILKVHELDVGVQAIASEQYRFDAPRPTYSVLDCSKYKSLDGPAMPHWRDGLVSMKQEM